MPRRDVNQQVSVLACHGTPCAQAFAMLKGDCCFKIQIFQTTRHLKAKLTTSAVAQCTVNCSRAGGITCMFY